jgi:hypothetical protein
VQRARVRQRGQAAVPDVPEEPAAPGAAAELLLLADVLQGGVGQPQGPPRAPRQYVARCGVQGGRPHHALSVALCLIPRPLCLCVCAVVVLVVVE